MALRHDRSQQADHEIDKACRFPASRCAWTMPVSTHRHALDRDPHAEYISRCSAPTSSRSRKVSRAGSRPVIRDVPGTTSAYAPSRRAAAYYLDIDPDRAQLGPLRPDRRLTSGHGRDRARHRARWGPQSKRRKTIHHRHSLCRTTTAAERQRSRAGCSDPARGERARSARPGRRGRASREDQQDIGHRSFPACGVYLRRILRRSRPRRHQSGRSRKRVAAQVDFPPASGHVEQTVRIYGTRRGAPAVIMPLDVLIIFLLLYSVSRRGPRP